MATIMLFGTESLRHISIKYFGLFSSFALVLVFIAHLYRYCMLFVRRIKFQQPGATQVRWGLDFTGAFPAQTCNDSDPLKSWYNRTLLEPIGCNNLLFDGNTFEFLLLQSTLPMIMRVEARTAILATATNSTLLLAACVALGMKPSGFAVPLLFHAMTGALVSFLCSVRSRQARDAFAVDKGIQLAAQQRRSLLHTLIPENVELRIYERSLAPDGSGGALAADVALTTVMFCALERQEELRDGFSEDVFDLLGQLIADFDDAVGAAGMYKYQHVGGMLPSMLVVVLMIT